MQMMQIGICQANRRLDKATAYQNRLIRQREAEFNRDVQWGGRARYYDSFQRRNAKHDEWTSPRYYEESARQHAERTRADAKRTSLAQRRERLRQLLDEEAASHAIELQVANRGRLAAESVRKRDRMRDIPTEILRDVNLGLQQVEERRQRHEAELKLYHSWRNANPILLEHERRLRTKDVKLAWLDQQIEKRRRDEEEARRAKVLERERQQRRDDQAKAEEQLRQETARRNDELQSALLAQMQQLQIKERQHDELKLGEASELQRLADLEALDEKIAAEKRKRADRELALHNLRQHKLKIKQRADDIDANLKAEQALIEQVLSDDVLAAIADEQKKRDLKRTQHEFLALVRQQRELERRRRHCLGFVFDSEAQRVLEQQDAQWRREQAARDALLDDVMCTLRAQIDANLQRNRDAQALMVGDRQRMLDKLLDEQREVERTSARAERQRRELRTQWDEQVVEKQRAETDRQRGERKRIEDDLERIRLEEKRLNEELETMRTADKASRGQFYGRKRMHFY